MKHVRQQIREEIKSVLIGLSTTGNNVFTSRVYNYDTLPSLSIYTLSEERDEETFDKQLRILNVVIEARVKATTALDDTLDQIGVEVESALFANNNNLNGKCKSMDYDGVEIELSDDGEQPVGLMRMKFMALYRVYKKDVSTLID